MGKKKVISYTLYFAGLFGRNRTAKKDSVELAEVPEGQPLAEDEVRAKVDAAIDKLKVKASVEFRYSVVMCPMTIEVGPQFTSRSFEVFGGSTVLKGTRPAQEG